MINIRTQKKLLAKKIVGCFIAFFMLWATESFDQISYSNNFDVNSTGWTGDITRTTATTACGTASMRKNLYSSVTTGNMVTPAMTGNNGGVITISYKYKAANWSANTVGTNPWGYFNLQYSTGSATGPWTTAATVSQETQNGSCISKTHTFSPPASTNLWIKWDCYRTAGDYYINFDDVAVSQGAPPSCLSPSALTGTPTTATTANISWTAPLTPPSNGYEYAVTTSATPPGSGTAFAGTSTSVSGLTANTTYYLHVRSYCGGSDYSSWATSAAFTTPCVAISSLPWTEGFESATLPNLPSACWLEDPSSGDWITTNNSNSTYDADARTGTQFLRDAYSATNEFVWTPGFTLTSGQSYDFSFWWAGDNYSGWTGDIFYNTVQSGTGATQMGSSFVTSGTTTTKTYAQAKRTFIAPTTGTYYFAIRVNATSSPWYLSFDDFRFEQTPSCQSPTVLLGTPTTPTTANISWTAPLTPPSNGYEYAVTTSATPPGSGTAFAGTSTSVSGLTAQTTYYLHVRSYCGGSSYSSWATSAAFTTPCAAISTLPWTEGFESATLPNLPSACWLEDPSSGDWVTTDNSNSTYDADARTGAQFLRDAYSATNEFVWTPGFALTSGQSYDFSFWWAGDNYSGWTGDIFYNTVQSGTGATQMGSSFVTSGTTTTKTYAQAKRTFIAPTTGTYYFAIRVNATSSPWYLSFDDFRFEQTPSCIAPTSPSGTPTSATTANISWTAPSPAPTNGYEYWVSTSATPPASGTTNAGTSASVTGLTASTTYYLHVRSNCGGGDFSSWATSTPFTTSMDCSAATVITCGTNFSFSVASGSGTWNTTATGTCSATPGKEKLYSFTPASTGAYYLANTVAGTGDFVDAYIKPAAGGCSDAASWTCVGWYYSTTQNRSLGTLTAGTEYYIMIDVESTTASTQTLNIACLVPPPANDDCAGATAFSAIPTDGSCANLALNTAGATQSLTGCLGTADDDVWFKFVQPAGFTTLNFTNTTISGNTDRVIQFFSACGGTSLTCSDPETGTVTGLTPGATYYGRIYTYGSGTSTNVTVCLSVPPPAPANDNCAGATAFSAIPTDGSCANLALNTAGATQSLAGCAGTADDDVWFKFVQPAGFTTINFVNTTISGNSDQVIQFFSACGGTSLKCSDPETGTVTGLTPGATYYGRIYTYGSGTSTNVTVCLSVPPPAPANDDCAGAKLLTNCAKPDTTKNLSSATQSLPAITCGGFTGTADDDIWYKFVASASTMYITCFSTYDAVMDLRSGACNGTNIACADDGIGTNTFEDIVATGLTVGNTYYVRIYSYSSTKPSATDYVWVTVGEGGCWQGASSSDWADINNWSNMAVPNACATNVTIPAGTAFSPTISSASYAVGNVNIASGTMLTISGANNLNVCGNWNAGSGSIVEVAGTGKVVLNGNSAQTIDGKTTFSTLQINKSSGSTVLNSGAVSNIATALELKSGNFNVSSGSLTLKSADADNAAMLDNFSTGFSGTITGNISAERGYNSAQDPALHKQHFFSSPINNVAITQFAPASGVNGGWVTPKPNCDEMAMASSTNYGNVFEYDESHVATCHLEGWKVRSAGTADNARAYSVVKQSAGTLTLSGTPNLGSYTISNLTNSGWTSMLTPQGNSYESGWSLLGNPYSASLDLDYAANGDFDNAIQVLHTNGMFAGTYQPVTMNSSSVIAPFQGFMVHKTLAGGTSVFSINANNRSRTTATFQKNAEHQMNLTVVGNGFADVTYFNFDANSTTGFDADKDGGKLSSYNGQPTLYSIIGAVWTSINTNPDVSSTPNIPVGFNPGSNGTFQITGSGFDELENTTVYLEDKETNTMHNLTAVPEYTFSSNKNDNTERFVLHFNYEMPSSIKPIVASSMNIFSYNNNVVVDFSNAKTIGEHTIVIYDIMGRVISNEHFVGKVYTKALDVQEPMYVVVKTNDGTNVISKKLFVTK